MPVRRKKGSGSGTSGEKKSSKKADAVKDKTKEKTEASSTEELTESKEKETTSGTASASSKNEGKSIPELVGSKVTDTWTHMKLFTRILSLFALAGVLYLLLWTGARTQFQKNKKAGIHCFSSKKNPKGGKTSDERKIRKMAGSPSVR